VRCPREYLIEGRAPKGWQRFHKMVEAERKREERIARLQAARGVAQGRGVPETSEKPTANPPELLTPVLLQAPSCRDPWLHDVGPEGRCPCGWSDEPRR